MTDTLRDLFPEDLSDETAYHIGNFLYELSLAFEGIYYGQIKRYHKAEIDVVNEMHVKRNQGLDGEEE